MTDAGAALAGVAQIADRVWLQHQGAMSAVAAREIPLVRAEWLAADVAG